MPKEEQTPPVQIAIEYLERFHYVKGQSLFNSERSLPDDIQKVLDPLAGALQQYKNKKNINALTHVLAFIFHTAKGENGKPLPNDLSLVVQKDSSSIDYADPENLPKLLKPISLDPSIEAHKQFNKRLLKVNKCLQEEIKRRDAIHRVSNRK
ncbi:MAG: hypothetical protein ABIH77_01400 [Pseudomonadota bacterium]|nr:hypothetical protein [Gammaproteobacteria bacterium]